MGAKDNLELVRSISVRCCNNKFLLFDDDDDDGGGGDVLVENRGEWWRIILFLFVDDDALLHWYVILSLLYLRGHDEMYAVTIEIVDENIMKQRMGVRRRSKWNIVLFLEDIVNKS